MKVRFDQLLIGDVDAWRSNGASDHLLFTAEEVVIVGVAVTGKAQYQCRSTAAARASAALGIVSGRRRYVTHMNRGEILYVDPQLHRRRAEEDGQFARVEIRFAFFSSLGGNL